MNTIRFRNKNEKIWLNVASSTFVIKDYINLDNHPFLKWLPFFKTFYFLLSLGHK